MLEESEAIDQEFADAIEQLKAIREEDDDNWLMGINPNPPSGDAVSGEQYRLPDDYPLPREILREHFPRTADQCNFSGGWGYDVEHAVIVKEFDPEINPDEKFDGVSLEYAFIDKRIREELIFSRPEGERFEEFDSCTIEPTEWTSITLRPSTMEKRTLTAHGPSGTSHFFNIMPRRWTPFHNHS